MFRYVLIILAVVLMCGIVSAEETEESLSDITGSLAVTAQAGGNSFDPTLPPVVLPRIHRILQTVKTGWDPMVP